MATVTIYTRASRATVRAALLRLSARVRGASGDATMARCAQAVQGRIRQAFVIKAQGGTDEAGSRWAPLAPSTIAKRKRKGGLVEILIDTGLLLNSLTPGAASAEQVLRIGHGEAIVGTNRKGAVFHHVGIPGRLPQRRLWPAPGSWPSPWWADLLTQAREGLIDLATQLIREAGN